MSSVRKTGARSRVLKAKSTIAKAEINTLLEFLGVDPSLYRAAKNRRLGRSVHRHRGSGPRKLWDEKTDQIAILRLAREGWLKIMKENHPDTAGKSGLKLCAQANEAWTRIKRVFASHGFAL